MAEDKEKKIIVDEDWKKEAQQEKEKLAKEEKAEKEKEDKEGTEEQKEKRELPKGDFKALLSMLATQAFFAMGLIQLEGQEKREPDLQVARYNIDMLETLEEKTKGNLSDEESKILNDTLNQLRMAYVKMTG